MRPAEVCGWTRYPRSSSVAISLRMVAELTPRRPRCATTSDPTGSAVSIYERITVRKISCLRVSSSGCTASLPGGDIPAGAARTDLARQVLGTGRLAREVRYGLRRLTRAVAAGALRCPLSTVSTRHE